MDGRMDFAISFVSLGEISHRVVWQRLDILNDIESGEKDKLSVLVLGHCGDVGFENFYNILAILCGGHQVTP